MGLLTFLSGGGDKEEAGGDGPVQSAPSTSGTSEYMNDPAASLSSIGRERLYDPYEGVSQAIGGKKLVFQLPAGPEFVFAEEAAVHRRSWTENLQFYAGLGYVLGGSTGLAAGAYKTVRTIHEIPATSVKLRTNRLLNTSGSLGRSFGNAAGVLGLYFATFETYFAYLSNGRAPDILNTTAAGFATSALFRSPRGPRVAAVAGCVGAMGGLAITGLRYYFPSL